MSIDQAPNAASTDEDTTTTLTASATQNAPYKPTQVELLAAHIYAFVSSASALSTALSNPSSGGDNSEIEYGTRSIPGEGASGNIEAGRIDDRDTETGSDRENDDEVKLLRLRTKIHEIIIIPDRRFLLCVVHDVSVGGPGGGGSHR